ncbi:MAG TPA: DUF86 domain-containing protein [Terriglobia bacterium]|nr:DUF86 domain-containing protein [Terriglobia bacterium]
MWKDNATAADILLAAQDIERFTAGPSYEDFVNNRMVQSAVVFRIMVMGEATKRLSEDFRRNHPSIEWKELAGMRDRCVHGYDSINLDVVWQVVRVDAPAVEKYLKTIVKPPPTKES